jgi:hypothetical protein
MNKRLCLILAFMLIFSLAFSQAEVDLDVFKDGLHAFLDDINLSLPDSTLSGVTWSDAYIGQIIGVPPHFGVGLATGISRFRVAGLAKTLDLVGSELPMNELIFPTIALEGRLGGFILPFDIGLRFGFLPEVQIKDVGLKYLHYGADIRYALLKQNLVLPNISLALGYYGTSGALSYVFTLEELTDASFPGITDKPEKLAIDFQTNVIDGRLQVSKSFLVVTPYAGFGLSYDITNSSYKLINETDTASEKGWQYRAFGGLSFNIVVVKIDLSGMYNFKSENWGANLGLRVQL